MQLNFIDSTSVNMVSGDKKRINVADHSTSSTQVYPKSITRTLPNTDKLVCYSLLIYPSTYLFKTLHPKVQSAENGKISSPRYEGSPQANNAVDGQLHEGFL